MRMRRLLVATAVIMFSLTAPAQTYPPTQSPSPAQGQSGEHPATVCVVSGRVVAAAEGGPLKSARVVLVPEHSGAHQEIYGATTDPDGQFVLKDVPPGRYRFLATHNGFVDEEYTGKSADAPVTLSLSAGQKVSDVLFRMTIAAVITGRVTNDDGEAMVRLLVEPCSNPVKMTSKMAAHFPGRRKNCGPLPPPTPMTGGSTAFLVLTQATTIFA
jgi:hypothetical protein